MNETNLEYFRDLIFKALFSDSEIKSILLLKGGQLLNVFGISDRASYDIDFTIESDKNEIFKKLEPKMKLNLENTLCSHGYLVIDYTFKTKPGKRHPTLPPYWGGYEISFKIISKEKEKTLKKKWRNEEDLKQIMSKAALQLGSGNSTKISIDLSYHEYSGEAEEIEISSQGITIRAYRPIIVIYEKIRALCQNIPGTHLPTNKANRSRDLLDIYKLIYTESPYSSTEQEILSIEYITELMKVFASKKVPLELLLELEKSRDNLEIDFNEKLIQTSPDAEKVTFYFLYEMTNKLMKDCYSIASSIHEG